MSSPALSSPPPPDPTFTGPHLIDPTLPSSTQAAHLAFERRLEELTFSERLDREYLTHLNHRKLKVEKGHDRTHALPGWVYPVVLSTNLKTKRQIEAEMAAELLVWQSMVMVSESDNSGDEGEENDEGGADGEGGRLFSTVVMGSGAELDADAMITEQGDFWEEEEEEEEEENMDEPTIEDTP